MDRLPGDLWALFSKGIQRLAHQDAGSFCFHPLHPLRSGFTCLRKLLTQLPNPACRAKCASIHLGNPGLRCLYSENVRPPLLPLPALPWVSSELVSDTPETL